MKIIKKKPLALHQNQDAVNTINTYLHIYCKSCESIFSSVKFSAEQKPLEYIPIVRKNVKSAFCSLKHSGAARRVTILEFPFTIQIIQNVDKNTIPNKTTTLSSNLNKKIEIILTMSASSKRITLALFTKGLHLFACYILIH